MYEQFHVVILAHLIKYLLFSVSDMPQLAEQIETCTNHGPHPSEPDTGGEEFTHKCTLLFIPNSLKEFSIILAETFQNFYHMLL